MLHNERMLKKSASEPTLAVTEARQLRHSLMQRVSEAAPAAAAMQQRRRVATRRKEQALVLSRMHSYCQRVRPGEQGLSMEQETALEACFAALESEAPVGKSRIAGKISSDDLSLALKSLGFSEAEELDLLHHIRYDETARLTVDEFVRAFSIGPKPKDTLDRLTSIGKVLVAAKREEADRQAREAYVMPQADPDQAAEERRLDYLNDLAHEAFPFSVVTDAHRIKSLVSSYSPHERQQVKTQTGSRRATRKGRLSREVRTGVRKVVQGTFENSADLEAWMIHFGIDTSGWGQGSTKKVEDLFVEIETKETTIQMLDGKMYRCLDVIKLVMRQPGRLTRHVCCYQQKLSDGRIRERDQLPSEKMLEGEHPVDAAARAVLEEFSTYVTELSAIEILPDTLKSWYEIVDSPSFPNLSTQYKLHEIEAVVCGLPSESFTSVEGKKEHFWEWRGDGSEGDHRRASKEGET